MIPATIYSQQWMDAIPVADNRNFYKIQEEFNKYWEGKVVTKGVGWKPFKRWEWFWGQRVFPSGILPRPDILKVNMDEHIKKFPKQKINISANWSSLGPATVPNVGSQGHSGLGRINCIAIHPTTSSTIFVGAASGGLWKSTDSGTNWTTVTDNLGSLGVTSIAFDPNDANTIYIATGDGDASNTYSLGVMKSTNGGNTWNTTGLSWTTSQTTTISKIVVHPTNSNIILASTSLGVYKTSNAGTTWSQVLSDVFLQSDLEVNIVNPTIWYAAYISGGIYKSTNSGDSFTKLTTDLPSGGFGRIAIAVSGSTVYSLFCNSSSGFYGLYKSTNDGINWTQKSTTPNILSWDGTGTTGQGWYDLTLDVDPINSAIVYAGGVNNYRSTNSGVNWTKISEWYTGTGISYSHADQHAFAFLPGTSTTIFNGNDGGIYKSTNSGTTWVSLHGTGLAISQFYKLGNSATNANRIFVGAQDNGSSKIVSSTWTHINGGDGMETIIDFTDENIGYTSTQNGTFYKTTNGGTSFTILSTGAGSGGWVTPFVMNPLNSNSLYIGTASIYKSVNKGGNWTSIGGTLSGSALYDFIAIAPSDTNTIYASNLDLLYKTTNNGTSWAQVTSGASIITSIAVHPTDPNKVYITFSGYGSTKVQMSTNGGTTWSSVSSGIPSIPVNTIAIHPSNGNQIVVGTDVGVYYSANGGTSWEFYNTNLPNVIVNDLEFHVSSNKLRAATYGRGLWETPFSVIPLGSITGTVFQDVNNNAVYDSGTDYLLQNYKVKISGVRTDSTYTNSSGVYTFSSLDDGSYTVTLASVNGWVQTLPTNNGTYSATISSANTLSNKTFGFYTAPPTATAQSVSTNEDVAQNITLTGSDPEGVALTYSVATNPTKGTLSGTAPDLTFTPTANLNGSDSFNFTVSDGSMTTSTATVSITINAVNDSPVATAQTANVTGNSSVAITLSGTDVEGSSLTYTVATNPTRGTLTGTAPNLTYTPTSDATNSDSFTFTVNDGSATSAAATVSINITNSVAPQYSISLNGSNQNGLILENVNFNITSNLTIEMWVKPNNFINTPFVIYQGTQGYNIYFQTNGIIYHYDYSSNYAASTTAIVTSLWSHIAVTVQDNPAETKFYINGVHINTFSGEGLGTGLSNFYLGASAGGSYLNGNIKDVRVWNVVRTATEISENYLKTLSGSETGLVAYYKLNQSSGTTFTNYSSIGSSLDLTVNNSPTWSTTSYPPLSSLQTSYTTTQQAIWNLTGTSNSTTSNGLWFSTTSALTDGNYIVYGNNNTSAEVTTDLTGTSCTHRTGKIWYLDVSGTANVKATIDLSVATGISGAIANGSATNFKLLRRSGTSGDFAVVAQGSSIASTDQVTFDSYSFTDGYYAVGTLNGTTSPLPVELKNFKVQTRNGDVVLTWETITETNNYGFEVERVSGFLNKKDNLELQSRSLNWQKVGYVRGSGTSSIERDYLYEDKNLRDGKYSYRLKQIDLDGSINYSEVKELEVGKIRSRIRTNPNPFNSTTIINYQLAEAGSVTIKLYDMLGRVVEEVVNNEVKEEGEHEIKFNASHLTSGVYLIKLQTERDYFTEKLVLLR